MNSSAIWQILWQQTDWERLLLAFVSGIIVSGIYFHSLRWSVAKLTNSQSRHRIKLFAGTALLRIALFFGVLVLVAHKNLTLIIAYLLAFFVTKMLILGFTKKHWGQETDAEPVKKSNGDENDAD